MNILGLSNYNLKSKHTVISAETAVCRVMSKLIFIDMVNYSLAQRQVGCYGDNLPPKVISVEYLNAYLTTAVSICLMFLGIKLKKLT